MPLTDLAIRAAKATDARLRMFDSGGLYLEVAPSGQKAWRLAYRFEGKQRTLLLGTYPDLRLTDARLKRDHAKLLLAEGGDPGPLLGGSKASLAEKQAAERGPAPAAPDPKDPALWENLVEAYLGKREREGAAAMTLAKLRLHAAVTLQHLTGRRAREIKATHIIDCCRVYEEQGKMNSAHAVRTLCSQVMRYAIARDLADFDPASPARDALAKIPTGGLAAITDPAAVGKLIRDIRTYRGHEVVRLGLLLSAYLFPRSATLRHMTWDQIDEDAALWTVPAANMKKARDFLVPLPRQALLLIAALREINGARPRVFWMPGSQDGLMSENTLNQALRMLGYDGSTHVHHGFRTTFSTNMNELGWEADWIEAQLAHEQGNKVRAAYNKARYLDQRRDMMQLYADWLDRQASGIGCKTGDSDRAPGPGSAPRKQSPSRSKRAASPG